MANSENLRWYAAGFLHSSRILAAAGHEAPASLLLAEVEVYMRDKATQCPPPMIDLIVKCKQSPSLHTSDIKAIEDLFVHDANTMLEEAGIRIGSA